MIENRSLLKTYHFASALTVQLFCFHQLSKLKLYSPCCTLYRNGGNGNDLFVFAYFWKGQLSLFFLIIATDNKRGGKEEVEATSSSWQLFLLEIGTSLRLNNTNLPICILLSFRASASMFFFIAVSQNNYVSNVT